MQKSQLSEHSDQAEKEYLGIILNLEVKTQKLNYLGMGASRARHF